MAKDEMGSLGKLYGAALSAPFKLINLPFKSYKQYYGEPKRGDQYKGSFVEKQRLKKIIPLIYNGKNIEPNDQKFMDMFNDFLTSEGHNALDQSKVQMNCEDKENCNQYIYKSKGRKTYIKPKKSEDKEEEKNEEKETQQRYFISMGGNLNIDKKNVFWKKNNNYGVIFLGKKSKKYSSEVYLTTSRLPEKDDYLIFKSDDPEPLNKNVYYEVYKANKKTPNKEPIFLGDVSAKIYYKV